MVELDGTFAALADPTRRGVIELLRQGPRRAGDLSRALDVSAPALSRHLRVLRASGLVVEAHSEADARVRVYELRREPFDALKGWIDDVQGFWSAELASFKRYAERGRLKKKGLR